MTPIQFVPINISEPIQVFEKEGGEIVILNEKGEDITKNYVVKTVKRGQTETVVVQEKKKR